MKIELGSQGVCMCVGVGEGRSIRKQKKEARKEVEVANLETRVSNLVLLLPYSTCFYAFVWK
jgi:hypothetical protein